MKTKIGFIGLGLIGGSLAKAIRQYYPDCEIVAFDKNKETLALATLESVIDVAATSLDDNFRGCRYLFLCAPVSSNRACLRQLSRYLDEDCILSDVGSVKSGIHQEAESLGIGSSFIGGHPMAGSEKSGYANSRAMLLENAYYVLTPSDRVPPKKIREFQEFLQGLKTLPILLDAKTHDWITGTISHLPHIIAASLVGLVRDTDTKDERMKTLAAGGFKDLTRIASSSPVMWQHICEENKENIARILELYIRSLETAREHICAGDGNWIYQLFEQSRSYRNSISETSSGPIKKAYAVYCDIIDEAGGIAAIATILASSGINIKNIGIVHNREFEEGVLRIEFYDEAASRKAAELLQKYRYIVYER